MNKRQRDTITNFLLVIVLTAAAVVVIINFKDYVNRNEAMRAMQHLGQIVLKYRQNNGAVPPQQFVDRIKGDLEGSARLGEITYRGRWIGFGATDDEILAYTKKNYKSLIVSAGYVVLRLDGRVEWMNVKEFQKLLDQQQSEDEKRIGVQQRE